MSEYKVICDGCPNECRLEIYENGASVTVLGNKCGIGTDRAREFLVPLKNGIPEESRIEEDFILNS